MKNIYKLVTIVLLLMGSMTYAQQTPANKQDASILITGATIHIGNGDVIQNGAVGFENGKITFVFTSSIYRFSIRP